MAAERRAGPWVCSDAPVLADLRALRLLRFPTDDASHQHPPKVLALSERACPRNQTKKHKCCAGLGSVSCVVILSSAFFPLKRIVLPACHRDRGVEPAELREGCSGETCEDRTWFCFATKKRVGPSTALLRTPIIRAS